jgi:hypothetical protein
MIGQQGKRFLSPLSLFLKAFAVAFEAFQFGLGRIGRRRKKIDSVWLCGQVKRKFGKLCKVIGNY